MACRVHNGCKVLYQFPNFYLQILKPSFRCDPTNDLSSTSSSLHHRLISLARRDKDV